MRVAAVAAETLVLVGDMIRPGVTTEEINTFVHEHAEAGWDTCAPELPWLSEKRLHIHQ